jgi:RNA polymerase sigma factor (sigma-70 family)
MAALDGHDFEEFFRSELRSIVSTVYRITGDAGLSEEITQDAFVRALTRWRRLRHYDRPGAWVRRVAIRDAVRAVKRRARQEPVERVDGAVAAPLPSKDEGLTAAVDALPPQQRAAVALYYLEGRPTAEVADLLACSEATVRSHLHRARQQLAAVLGDERQEEVGDVRG